MLTLARTGSPITCALEQRAQAAVGQPVQRLMRSLGRTRVSSPMTLAARYDGRAGGSYRERLLNFGLGFVVMAAGKNGHPGPTDAGSRSLFYGHPPFNPAPPQPATHPTSERMPQSTALVARSALVILLAGAVGCASDVLLPDPAGGGNGPFALTKLTGDQQTGTVGEPLADPLVVKVLAGDQPAPNRKVAFMLTADPAAGTITPDTATTDSEGKAVAHWTLGTAPGDHLVLAQLVDADSASQIAEFRAAAMPGAPDTLSPASVLAQPGRREQVVATAPVVRVVDRYGNPVPNASVAWQVTAGQGEVGAPSTVTDADGKASVVWTLGSRSIVQKLTATTGTGSVTGSPITFTATVLF
jgi:hypothetical protein